MTARLARGVCAAVAAALAVAACGSSGSSGNGVAGKSPNDILTAANHAVTGLKSVHVAGSVSSAGTPITLDLDLLAGKGGKGTMSENGLSFQLVVVKNSVYVNGSPAFWQHFAGKTAAQLLDGKWLEAPASGQFASIVPLTSISELFQKLLSSHGALAKAPTTTIHGTKVIGVHDTTNGGTLYVATAGKPYPVEVAKTGSGGGKIDFTKFNAPVSLTAPAHAINISQLG